jgi:nucleotide-binding universal stress UspA family protein
VSYSHVLVGTDGSPTAGHAVDTASRVAVGLGVPLVVVTAWQRHQADPPARSEEARFPGGSAAAMDAQWAIETTSDAAGRARQLGVTEVRQLQPVAGPVDALLDAADAYPSALLVVGTAGLGDRTERIVGNVPHQLTHHCPVDLLLCSGPYDGDRPRIALATDGSRTAGLAVDHGLTLASAIGADVVLTTVARSARRGDALLDDEVARDDRLRGAERRVVTGGDPVRGLLEVAADSDVLVLGNKGMSGPSRLLGSVANRITHEVPTDLLLVNTTR